MERSLHTIIADDRERKSAVFSLLEQEEKFRLQTQRLPLGDYLIDDWLLIERKTLLDLTVSLRDGRLFSQAVRLANSDVPRAALVLEGTARDLQDSEMRREAIQGAILHIGLFLDLPVLRSRSPKETVRLFLYAARQGRAIATGSLPRPGRRPQGKAALQRHILQGLPGIGPERARQLLARFGTVEAVIGAEIEQLTAVPGIGPRTAQTMRWAVKERRADYRADDVDPI